MGERTWDDCLVADNQRSRGGGGGGGHGGRKEKLRRRRKRVLCVQRAVSSVSSGGGYSERVSIGGLLRRNVLRGENPSGQS